MLFALPFGLFIMCFALLFGLSAVGEGAEVLGDEPTPARTGRRSRRPATLRQRLSRRLRERSARRTVASRRASGRRSTRTALATGARATSAADYFGYDSTGADLYDDAYGEAGRLDEDGLLHMDQILGDGT